MHLNSPETAPAPRMMWIARAVWIVLLAAVVGRSFFVHHPRQKGIYPTYKLAGENWIAGKNIYSRKDSLEGFRYAPVAAASLTPLAAMPDIAGCLLFRSVNAAFFVAGAFALRNRLLPAPRGSVGEACYWLTLAPLAASGLLDTQVNDLTAGLMLLAIAGLVSTSARPPRWNLWAICLAAAVLLKVYPIALALLCMVLWPRELIWRFSLAMLAGLALPFLMQRTGYVLNQYRMWLHAMSVNDRQVRSLDQWYRDIRLPLELVGVHILPRVYLLIQILAGITLAGLVYLLRSPAIDIRHRLGILYSLAASWMMAFGPATEGVTYIILAPAVAWMATEALLPGHGNLWRTAVSIVWSIFALTEASLWFPFGRALRNLSPQPVATIALLGLVVMLLLNLLRKNGPDLVIPMPQGAAYDPA
jgi:hypothetical protein